MNHLILVGDSVFDNRQHVTDGAEVVSRITERLPNWTVTLLARDGSTTLDIKNQVGNLVAKDADLLLSVGGNDALLRVDLLDFPVASTAESLRLFSAALADFKYRYEKSVDLCLEVTPRVILCTIYHGSFPDNDFQERAKLAVDMFNGVIIEAALARCLGVLDLRRVCNKPEDFEKEIEPSAQGGVKISSAIAKVLLSPLIHGTRIY